VSIHRCPRCPDTPRKKGEGEREGVGRCGKERRNGGKEGGKSVIFTWIDACGRVFCGRLASRWRILAYTRTSTRPWKASESASTRSRILGRSTTPAASRRRRSVSRLGGLRLDSSLRRGGPIVAHTSATWPVCRDELIRSTWPATWPQRRRDRRTSRWPHS